MVVVLPPLGPRRVPSLSSGLRRCVIQKATAPKKATAAPMAGRSEKSPAVFSEPLAGVDSKMETSAEFGALREMLST